MMSTIRASCYDCGDVELTTPDVHVRVCTSDNQGTYSFRCPLCGIVVVKPAEPRTVDLLVAAGISYSTWSPPLELNEFRGFGEPIDHDELLDFHKALQDDEMTTEALANLVDDDTRAELIKHLEEVTIHITLKMRVDELKLTRKIKTLLYDNKIFTLGDLVEQSESDLLDISGFGPKALTRVIKMLEEWELTLRNDCD